MRKTPGETSWAMGGVWGVGCAAGGVWGVEGDGAPCGVGASCAVCGVCAVGAINPRSVWAISSYTTLCHCFLYR
jgi:hypothetical protein